MPTVSSGIGGGGAAGPGAGASAVLLGPNNGRHSDLRGFLSADQTFKVQLQISDDNGTTYYTAQEFSSSVVTGDAGSATFVNGLAMSVTLPTFWRLAIKNTGAGAMLYKYDFAIYDNVNLAC